MSNSKKDYSKIVAQARAAGLVNRSFERKNLTHAQKIALTNISKNYGEVLKKPDKFFVKKVTEKTAKRLKDTEHKIVNGHLILHKRGYEHLKVKTTKDSVTFIKANGDRSERSKFYASGADFLKAVESVKLREGQTITARFGNAGSAFPTRFDSPLELLKYLSKFGERQLMALSIVKFNGDDDEIEHDE